VSPAIALLAEQFMRAMSSARVAYEEEEERPRTSTRNIVPRLRFSKTVADSRRFPAETSRRFEEEGRTRPSRHQELSLSPMSPECNPGEPEIYKAAPLPACA
jgi:hypothetical protein